MNFTSVVCHSCIKWPVGSYSTVQLHYLYDVT